MVIEDSYLGPAGAKHPMIQSGNAPHSYAGFPVINKDNYALGTLCLFNSDVKKLSLEQVDLIKRITKNIAHLLDLQVEQRSLTAEKIVRASDALSKELDKATLQDFNTLLLLESDMAVDEEDAMNLVENKFCKKDTKSNIVLTADGRRLIEKMGLTPKPMKRLKITGSDASELLDRMFSELE